jgi:hypothetical protein
LQFIPFQILFGGIMKKWSDLHLTLQLGFFELQLAFAIHSLPNLVWWYYEKME